MDTSSLHYALHKLRDWYVVGQMLGPIKWNQLGMDLLDLVYII